jgi:hypothetical protein
MPVSNSWHHMEINGSKFWNSTVNNGPVGSRVDVGELRQLLQEHRTELVRLGGTRGERVESRIEEIEEELAAPEPDKPAVRSAWESVLRVIKGGAAAAESVSKITDAIRSLSGA